MNKEKMYSIALRKRLNGEDHYWYHKDYNFIEYSFQEDYKYWFADPFLFEHGGVTYVFYEAYDLIQHKGKIGYSILEESKKKLKVNIIIEEPFHLSFPNVIVKNGDIYMMPETCEANSVKLYKAVEFPNKWIEYKTLVDNVFVCDSIILNEQSTHPLLITNEMYRNHVPNGNYSSCWVRNYAYPLNKNLEICGKKYFLTEGDYGVRNAGKCFVNKGVLYRVGQNCVDRQYGKGLVFHEITSLLPYQEKVQWCSDCKDFENHIKKAKNLPIIGVHTYNYSEHFEVIDFSQMRVPKFRTKAIRNQRYSLYIVKRVTYVLLRKVIDLFKRNHL